jgi:DHA1 family multidrug resistance protein-like MFS transporter
MAAAMLWPSVYASVGDRIDEKRQGQALSSLNITYLLGIATGPYIGGFANDTLGAAFAREDARRYVPSFLVGAACFLVSAVLAGLFAPRKAKTPLPAQQHHTEEAQDPTVGEIAVSAHPPVGWDTVKRNFRKAPVLMLLGFLVFAAVGLIAPHAKPYFMDRLHLTEERRFGELLLWPALVIGLASPFVGKLTDFWGKPNSIHAGMGLCAAGLWMMIFVPGEAALIALGSVLGVGFVLAFPAYMAYINDVSDPNERGGLIGAVRMAQGIGAFAGAVAASPLYTLDIRPSLARLFPAAAPSNEAHLALFCMAGLLLTLSFLLSLFYIREQPKATPLTPAGEAAR